MRKHRSPPPRKYASRFRGEQGFCVRVHGCARVYAGVRGGTHKHMCERVLCVSVCVCLYITEDEPGNAH